MNNSGSVEKILCDLRLEQEYKGEDEKFKFLIYFIAYIQEMSQFRTGSIFRLEYNN